MKKRIARIVVYFGLLCLSVLVLSHPYIWQSVFGPKIKGEPLWAWQQEFRARCDETPGNPTLWAKLLQVLKIDSRPLRWMGSFESSDPELLPVLISLADDHDESVRRTVAYALGAARPEQDAVGTLIHMLDDPSSSVRHAALHTLLQFQTKSVPALPKLRILLKDADPEIQMQAALVMSRAGELSPEVRTIVRAGAKSPLLKLRRFAYYHLTDAFKDDEEIFITFANQSTTEPRFNDRCGCIRVLHRFGAKGVAPLMAVLRDPARKAERWAAVTALAGIGPGANEAIPMLESLLDDPDPQLRMFTAGALDRIDPERAAKK